MILNHIEIGNNNSNILVILHGLYGSGESWTRVANLLSDKFKIYLPDLRNHGESFHNPSHTYPELVEDLKSWADYLGLEKFNLLGHSMGGKTAMFFANKYSQYINKLIVADISPRNYSNLMQHVPSINFHLNLISMMLKLEPEKYKSYRQVAENLVNYEENIKNIILKNLTKKDGKMYWKLNLQAISDNLPEIMKGLDADDFIEKKILLPTLFLKGSLSNYITNQDFKLIEFIFPNSKIEIVENTGHWLHFEKPQEVANKIIHFLSD
ncbi:MAG: alpha/beta fold hydrolase [Bacteroidales bacterium]|jgi:pimeloyl-ACP methyl ester carboxylesterase|nr:alpha/beta fold hydrolase [Bacteroidales bacterium]MCK9498087.1 alpha/beta fold hydrolase [Bacteroidales bacterium]MDY0313577.1 alpha/beta fold hydrolase [Bacteroidales bacterium]NLB86959.1 alpha/beta fold hydrolase [Bacteroidales bacterium]NLB87028.1 alpha/beta fold hydrolase [Bacteroidales bacterium]